MFIFCGIFLEVETEIVKSKRTARERPISFSKMDDIKNRWESTSQQGRREVQREARKEEIAGIRSRLFLVIYHCEIIEKILEQEPIISFVALW